MKTDSPRALPDSVVQIVSSFASRENATPEDIMRLLHSLCSQLGDTALPEAAALPSDNNIATLKVAPAVAIADSVTDDSVVCLCCGRSFTMLKRHLMAEHGLTEEQYRLKFGLPESHPLVAPNYSIRKAEYAKRIGLGRYSRVGGITEADSSSA